jgi:hypothetical protein
LEEGIAVDKINFIGASLFDGEFKGNFTTFCCTIRLLNVNLAEGDHWVAELCWELKGCINRNAFGGGGQPKPFAVKETGVAGVGGIAEIMTGHLILKEKPVVALSSGKTLEKSKSEEADKMNVLPEPERPKVAWPVV